MAILSLLPTKPLAAQAQAGEEKAKAPQAESYSAEAWAKQRQRNIYKEHRKDGEIRFKYAHTLYLEAHYERAQELWEHFVALFPSHPRRIEAMRYLAMIAEKQERFQVAMDAYVHTYQQDPGADIALQSYLQAGRLAGRLGKLSMAQGIFKKIAKTKGSTYFARAAQVELDALKINAEN